MTGKVTNGFDMDNWTTQLRKGLLELCIVSLLSEREMYGYDLVKRLAAVKGVVVTEGTVYPLLSRLRKAGLVAYRLEESPSGPARKYYVLTDQGRRAVAMMRGYWNELIDGVAGLLDGALSADDGPADDNV
jgi:PadR family transcriptional regulator PadR